MQFGKIHREGISYIFVMLSANETSRDWSRSDSRAKCFISLVALSFGFVLCFSFSLPVTRYSTETPRTLAKRTATSAEGIQASEPT